MDLPSENLSKIADELEQFLRSKLDDGVSIIDGLHRLEGGFDTDTFAFEIENAPVGFPANLVLRLFRSPRDAPRVTRESTIQNAAHDAGHPVPAVPIDSLNKLLIGRPFLLMELLPGSALGTLLEDDELLAKVPGIMARLQVGLHQTNSAGLRKSPDSAGIASENMTPDNMLEQIGGMASVAVQKIAGHKKIETTLRYYVRVDQADLVAAVERLSVKAG